MIDHSTDIHKFASILMNDLEPLFNNMAYAVDDGKFEEALEYRKFIEEFIYQRTCGLLDRRAGDYDK